MISSETPRSAQTVVIPAFIQNPWSQCLNKDHARAVVHKYIVRPIVNPAHVFSSPRLNSEKMLLDLDAKTHLFESRPTSLRQNKPLKITLQ